MQFKAKCSIFNACCLWTHLVFSEPLDGGFFMIHLTGEVGCFFLICVGILQRLLKVIIRRWIDRTNNKVIHQSPASSSTLVHEKSQNRAKVVYNFRVV